MKLYRVFLIVLMTSAFAVVGCGDSNDASSVCKGCVNSNLIAACEAKYNNCRNVDRGGHEECSALALLDCAL